MKNLLLVAVILIGYVAIHANERRIVVILVNFQDMENVVTRDQAAVTLSQVNDFYLENSYGQLGFSGDVFGAYTIPVSSTICDKNAIAYYSQQAAAADGVNLSEYQHQVYLFPRNSCLNSASLGDDPYGQVFLKSLQVGVWSHELGHNLWLHHSQSFTNPYGDDFCVMGGTLPFHFNIFQKERAGWVTVPEATQTGTYLIAPYETLGGGLKVRKSDGVYYYLEKRVAYGFDAVLSSSQYNLMNGVLLHQGGQPRDIYLIDAEPVTAWMNDAALTTGKTFSDGSVSVTVNRADETGAEVYVAVPEIVPTPTPTPLPTPVCVKWNPKGKCLRWG